MMAPGGRIEWLCPDCRGPNICRVRIIPAQKSGECRDCQTWWPWRQRIKRRAQPQSEGLK